MTTDAVVVSAKWPADRVRENLGRLAMAGFTEEVQKCILSSCLAGDLELAETESDGAAVWSLRVRVSSVWLEAVVKDVLADRSPVLRIQLEQFGIGVVADATDKDD